jgi:hypothetical protein
MPRSHNPECKRGSMKEEEEMQIWGEKKGEK